MRRKLAKELETRLPKGKYLVYADGADRDDIGKPTIVMQRARVEPSPTAPRAYRLNRFVMFVISDKATDAEDYLDNLADQVIDALSDIPGADFEYADRQTYGNSYPAYQISVVLQDDRQNKEQ
jgi:hypothetical protein